MKKVLILTIIISSIILTWCINNDISSSKQNSDNITVNNTWIDDNTFQKAEINNDKSSEATEEIEVTATWESATITSFWSWENITNSWWAN